MLSGRARHRAIVVASIAILIIIVLLGLAVYLVTRPIPVTQKLSQNVGKFGSYQGTKQTLNGFPCLQTSNGNYKLTGGLAAIVGINDGSTITVNGYLLTYPQPVNGVNGELYIASIQTQI